MGSGGPLRLYATWKVPMLAAPSPPRMSSGWRLSLWTLLCAAQPALVVGGALSCTVTRSPSISLAELSPQNIGAAMRLCSWTQERSSVLVPWGRKTMPVAFETGRRGKDGLPDLGGGPRVLRGRPVTDAACGGSQVGPRARCPWWPESACSEPAQRPRGWSVSLGPWAAVGNSLHVAFTSVDGQLLLRVLPGCVPLRCVSGSLGPGRLPGARWCAALWPVAPCGSVSPAPSAWSCLAPGGAGFPSPCSGLPVPLQGGSGSPQPADPLGLWESSQH